MDEVVLAHGTRLVLDDERLTEVIDRHGHRLARIAWRDGRLSSAMVWGELGAPAVPRVTDPINAAAPAAVPRVTDPINAAAPAAVPRVTDPINAAAPAALPRVTDPINAAAPAALIVSAGIVAHPVLGPAHALSCGAVMTAIDWARPARVPAIDRPAAIPGGAGTMLLDLIALCAQRAGVGALRYDGPYPTHALWGSLATCFRTAGASVDDFVAGRAPTIDFVPAPFERVHVHPRAWVELRDLLERASVDGLRYGICSSGAHRLVRLPDEALAAEVWIADAPLARVAVFDARGELVSPPTAPPPYASPVLGRAFPAPLAAALADLVGAMVPAPLADDARSFVASSRLAWADTGCELARASDASIDVHAALWDRLAPHGLARVALALAEAIEPLARRRAAVALAARVVSTPVSPH